MNFLFFKKKELNEVTTNDVVKKRLVPRIIIYYAFVGSFVCIAFTLVAEFSNFFEITHIERIFFHFMTYKEFYDLTTAIVFVLFLLSGISSVVIFFSAMWNIFHGDSKRLFLLVLLEIVIIFSTLGLLELLVMSGPKHLEFRSEMCSLFGSQEEADSCYKETASQTSDCKKVVNFEDRNECVNHLLQYPKVNVNEVIDDCTMFETDKNKDQCVMTYASKNDPLLCMGLGDVFEREPCLYLRALNLEQCTLITSDRLRGECFGRLKLETPNYRCNDSIDERVRLFCYNYIVHRVEDKNYCVGFLEDDMRKFMCEMHGMYSNSKQDKGMSGLEKLKRKENYCNTATSTTRKAWCLGHIDPSSYHARANKIEQEKIEQLNKETCSSIEYADDRYTCNENRLNNKEMTLFSTSELCSEIIDMHMRNSCLQKVKNYIK